jgi:hypothetical protein
MFRSVLFLAVFCTSIVVSAQTESLDNQTVIGLTRSGLSVGIISKKIMTSRPAFDVSAAALIELKKAGVDDEVITLMMERSETVVPPVAGVTNTSALAELDATRGGGYVTRATVLGSAKTIAFGKSSLQPSRQALEKELIKRPDFQKLNLTILRYKDQADLFVDIGYVSGSWLTHRYVFRIYDRRSGAVIVAGETTSWGSLAGNLARHIAKGLAAAREGRTS